MKKWRRSISSDVSCNQSPIQTNMTLKGGIEAGYFRKLAEHVAMQLCIELCCEEKGCDVAFMSGKNCYGVQCFSVELCQASPAMKKVSENVMIAHVTIKGERATSLKVLDNSENQLVCKNSQLFYNTTLKGGYTAGNYTNFGKVSNMSACVRLCCGNKDCDVALMLENNCFAVACRDSNNCLPVHAKTTTSLTALNPRISYITSRSEEVAVRDHLTSDGICHAGIISYDVSLRGGTRAGNFTPHGKARNMESCISKCCQIEGCGVAMMLKDTCFTVVCKNDVMCEKKQTPTSSNFNPKIAYVFRDKIKTTSSMTTSSMSKSMATEERKALKDKADMRKNKKLKHQKLHESLESLADRLDGISDEFIPTVSLASTYGALMVRSTKSSHHKNSTSSNLKKYLTLQWNNTLLNETMSTELQLKSDGLLNKTQNNDWKTFKAKDTLLESFLEQSARSKIDRPTTLLETTEGVPPLTLNIDSPETIRGVSHSTGNIPTRASTVIRTNVSDNLQPTNFNSSSDENIRNYLTDHTNVIANMTSQYNGNMTSQTLDNMTSVIDDPSCLTSDITHNVTLKGGIRSGKFKDRGQMEDIRQCARLCCLLKTCNLAFMLSETCFSVECFTQSLCEAIPAKSSMYSPTLCYVKSRNVTPSVT